MIMRLLAKLLPTKLKKFLKSYYKKYKFYESIILDYYYDIRKFFKYSAVNELYDNKGKLKARITIDYHKIEKGLSLPEPRTGFGAEVVDRLLTNMNLYQDKYGVDYLTEIVANNLKAYYNFNISDDDVNEDLMLRISNFGIDNGDGIGGIREIKKKDIQSDSKFNFEKFVNSRHSIRNFTGENVDNNLIQKAVQIAQKTPSVCNRQPWTAYLIEDKRIKKRILQLQNGNRGFGDRVNKLLIITSDLNQFVFKGERNQCWIDGGMFSMSLVYALHWLGIGSCCMNWAKQHNIDKKIRTIIDIPDKEVIIMLIGVGHLPDSFNVACSPRKPLEDVFQVLPNEQKS